MFYKSAKAKSLEHLFLCRRSRGPEPYHCCVRVDSFVHVSVLLTYKIDCNVNGKALVIKTFSFAHTKSVLLK